MKFFLVAPGGRKKLAGGRSFFRVPIKGGRELFWMEDKGESWSHLLKSEVVAKHPDDEVYECSLVDCTTELDWTKTPLHNDGLTSGWLCRSGRFYGCPTLYHDKLASLMLGMKVGDLEKMGWVRVLNKNYYTCLHRLSEEQKNWLSQNGHKVLEASWG